MELRTLRAFVEVVRQGGFSRAALTVFTTQSAVSKAVKQLEDELGVALLDRTGHKNELTDAGQIVFRRARTMLNERDDLLAELDELRGLKRGALRLGISPVGSSILFAPLFAAYRSRYPGIDIRLVEHGSNELQDLLHAGEVDLAALLLPVAPEFAWQEVVEEPLMALVPSDDPLAGKGVIDLAALEEHPFILFEQGFALNRIILDACKRRGFTPQAVARSAQIDFIIELVAAGLGVAFLPRILALDRPHAKVTPLLLQEPHTRWRLALAWRRGGYLSHAAQEWLTLAREAFAPTGENDKAKSPAETGDGDARETRAALGRGRAEDSET